MNDRNTIVKEIAGRSKIVLLLLNGIEKAVKTKGFYRLQRPSE